MEHHTIYQYNIANAADHYMGLIQTETVSVRLQSLLPRPNNVSQPYYQPAPAAPSPFAIDTSLMDPNYPSQQSAWALMVQNSQNIIVFGAGLYSFFQNFGQACLDNASCQSQILSVDNESTVWVYSLSTLGVTMQLSVLDTGVIPQSQNANGYQVRRDFIWENRVVEYFSTVDCDRVDSMIIKSPKEPTCPSYLMIYSSLHHILLPSSAYVPLAHLSVNISHK